jgi:acyl carrier protein
MRWNVENRSPLAGSQHIKRQIRRFVLEDLAHRKGVDDFADDDLLVCKGVIDSLGIIRLVSFLEDNFGIHIPDGDITEDHFASLNTLEHFVNSRMNLRIPDGQARHS